MGVLDETKTHWVVVKEIQFTGGRHIVERRKTRVGAYKAMTDQERWATPDEAIFEVFRSDDKRIKNRWN